MRIPKPRSVWTPSPLLLLILPLLIGGCPWDCDEDILTPGAPAGTPNIYIAVDYGFPMGFEGNPYDFEALVKGMTAPYTFEEIDLFLPPEWLSLTMSDGDLIQMTGTPDTAGEFSFKLDFTDADGDGNWVDLMVVVLESGALWITGDWEMTKDVTIVFGALCAGEENDPPIVETMLVTRTGSFATVTGFMGESTNTLSSYIYPPRGGEEYVAKLILTGSYPEDGGTTTVDPMRLYITDNYNMDGIESWTWAVGGGSCSGSSDVTMVRIP